MSYIGNEPIVSATRTITEVTATAGQTVFTANGGYTVGYIDVFLNGAQLQTVDFTATNGTTITLTEAAQVGDVIRLVAWGTFSTATHVPLTGNSNITGNVNVSGNVGVGTTSPTAKLQVVGEAIFGGAGTYQTVYANNNSATGGGAFTVQQNGTSRGGVAVSGAWLGDTSSDLAVFSIAPNIRFYNNNSSSERMRITSDGLLQFNSGYGSVATAYGCRAWVNFNGTGTPAIRASGNVSSLTDHGTGDYSVNFTTAMPDANFCGNATASNEGPSNRLYVAQNQSPMSASAWRIACFNASGSTVDANFVHVSIFR